MFDQLISLGEPSPTTCIFNFALGPNFIAAFLLPILIERFAGFLLKIDNILSLVVFLRTRIFSAGKYVAYFIT